MAHLSGDQPLHFSLLLVLRLTALGPADLDALGVKAGAHLQGLLGQRVLPRLEFDYLVAWYDALVSFFDGSGLGPVAAAERIEADFRL